MNNDKPAMVEVLETVSVGFDRKTSLAAMENVDDLVNAMAPGIRGMVKDMVAAAYKCGLRDGINL